MLGSTKRSVKLALGPSFGTCAFASAVLTLIQLIRNAMEQCVARLQQCRQRREQSCLACIG